ncbi:60S ribosomal protein L23A-like [Coffea eugenioides]|uniref:Uncharacterized protein n=1 Tax=Coffea arabica TaxID=13443 RepID=A0A6P6TIF6_COFAR|nr:60S ribosomal protein L23A-like [Coffea arabica]XP_027179689.1 60S ribosomal protein L23A-like [Coffea eugenioides]
MALPTAMVSPVAVAPSSMVTRSRQKGLSFIASKPITGTTTPPPQMCLILKFRCLTINANQAKLLPTESESWNVAINTEAYFTKGPQSWKHALRAAAISSSDAEGGKNVQQLAEPSRPRLSRKERNPKCLSSSAAQKVMLDHFQIVKYPLITDLTMRVMIENNTLTFVVDKRADKNNIKAAAKKMFKIETKKVNTLIMPSGNKKAYLTLIPDQKAVEVAKKIKII